MLIEPCGPLDFFPDLRFETTGLLLKGQRKGVGESQGEARERKGRSEEEHVICNNKPDSAEYYWVRVFFKNIQKNIFNIQNNSKVTAIFNFEYNIFLKR